MEQEDSTENGLQQLLKNLKDKGLNINDQKDIFDLITNQERKIQDLNEEVEKINISKRGLEEENETLTLEKLANRKEISNLQSTLRSKSNEVEKIYGEVVPRKTSVEISKLQDVISALQTEKDTLEKKIKGRDETEPIYVQYQTSGDVQNTNEDEMATLTEENSKLKRVNERLKLEVEIAQDKNSHLERIFGKSDDVREKEIKQIIDELEVANTKLRTLQSDNLALQQQKAELDAMNDKLQEKVDKASVIMRQKDEESMILHEQIHVAKREKLSKMQENEELVKELHDVKRQREEQFKKMIDDVNIARHESRSIQERFERYHEEQEKKTSALVDRNHLLEECVNDLQNELRYSNKKVASAQENIAQFASTLNVTLQKVEVATDRKETKKLFGVVMISKPSRVMVTEVIEKQSTLVRSGDYVISINNTNVQNASMKEICNLIGGETLNLVLCRPEISEEEIHLKNLEPGFALKSTMNVLRLTTSSAKAGVKFDDEIITINDHDVNNLSLRDIEKKLSKSSVKLRIRRRKEQAEAAADPRSQSVSSGGSNSLYESIDDGPTPKDGRRPSRLSLSSHSSSKSPDSSVASLGSPASQHRGDVVNNRKQSMLGDSFRRSPTVTSKETSASLAFKNSITDQDAIVTRDGVVIRPDCIRNNDTDGSGDTEVRRERPSRPESLDGYQSLIRTEPARISQPFSPSSSSTAAGRLPQDRADAASLSNVSRTSQHSYTSPQMAGGRKPSIPNPLLAHRPQEPLPNNAVYSPGGSVDDYKDREKDYDYVDMRHASQIKREETKEIILKKKEAFPSFGFSMFGGNKAGIFVDEIQMWTAAHEAGLKAGSKIIAINENDMTNAAFCYANELLKSFSSTTELNLTVLDIPSEELVSIRQRKPYDSFAVRTLLDLSQSTEITLPFKQNEILTITDSYKDYDSETGSYKWHASKPGDGVYGNKKEGSVPAEQSMVYKNMDDYPEEEFEDPVEPSKSDKKTSFAKIKKVLPWKRLMQKDQTKAAEDDVIYRYGGLYEYLDDQVKI